MDWEPAGKTNDASSQEGASKLPKKKKKWPIVVAVLVILVIIGNISARVTSCSNDAKEAEERNEATFTWPSSGLATQLPKPKTNNGEINSNSDTYFSADLYNVEESDYSAYIKAVKKAKFTDYSGEGTDYFSAVAPSGAKLSLNYFSDEKELDITLNAEQEESSSTDAQADEASTDTTSTDASSDTSSDASAASNDNGGVSADFKQTMDDYETFMNSYVDFMNKYKNSDDTVSMMTDYAKMMKQYSEWTEKFNAIDQNSLSAADSAYYLEVQARVVQKLSEVQ